MNYLGLHSTLDPLSLTEKGFYIKTTCFGLPLSFEERIEERRRSADNTVLIIIYESMSW